MTLDRSAWPPGPWDDEPDSVSWVSAVGLPCEMRRNGRGAWCGYVCAKSDHPAWGYVEWNLTVHGSVTWEGDSERLADGYPGEGPFPSGMQCRGFDCSHIDDFAPGENPGGDFPGHPRIYRDLAYVRAECESLAAQIDAAGILSEAGFGGPRHLRGDVWSAPAWAIEIARRLHVPREERATMLRWLASDPVAAQLAESLGVP